MILDPCMIILGILYYYWIWILHTLPWLATNSPRTGCCAKGAWFRSISAASWSHDTANNPPQPNIPCSWVTIWRWCYEQVSNAWGDPNSLMVCHGSYENGWGEHFRKSSYYVYRPTRLDICFLGSKKDVWHLKKTHRGIQRMSPIPKRYWRKPISQRGWPSRATNIPSDSLCSAFCLTLFKCGIRNCQSWRYYIWFTYRCRIWFSIHNLDDRSYE